MFISLRTSSSLSAREAIFVVGIQSLSRSAKPQECWTNHCNDNTMIVTDWHRLVVWKRLRFGPNFWRWAQHICEECCPLSWTKVYTSFHNLNCLILPWYCKGPLFNTTCYPCTRNGCLPNYTNVMGSQTLGVVCEIPSSICYNSTLSQSVTENMSTTPRRTRLGHCLDLPVPWSLWVFQCKPIRRKILSNNILVIRVCHPTLSTPQKRSAICPVKPRKAKDSCSRTFVWKLFCKYVFFIITNGPRLSFKTSE